MAHPDCNAPKLFGVGVAPAMPQQRVVTVDHVPGETAGREPRPSLDQSNIYTGLSKSTCSDRAAESATDDNRPRRHPS